MELELPRGIHRRSILESRARLNVWHGSVRSGKTVSSIIRWLDFIDRGPGGPLLMVGKTERTLRRNILELVIDLVGPDSASFQMGDGKGHIFGRPIYLASANDERSEGKIRGITLVGAYGDELTLWPESFFKMLLSRLSVRGAKFFGTTNPDGPFHWLKRDFIDREDELDLRSFHFTLRDNPTLDPAYVEAISQEYTGLWRKRFIDGLWVLAEGVIWDMFRAEDDERGPAHVIDELPPGVEIRRHYVSLDYGTSAPFVALLIGHGSDGVFYVLDQWRWDSARELRQLTDAEYSRELRRWLDTHGVTPARVFPDPSAASFIAQLRKDGFLVEEEVDNSVDDGLRVVGTAFAQNRLRVLRRCRPLIDCVCSYSWDPKAQERGEDKPLKKDDHDADALRYGMVMLDRGPAVIVSGGDPLPERRGMLNPFAGRRGRVG